MKRYHIMLIVPALILAAPARALEMVFESRSVFVSYYGGGIEMHSSNGGFGAFNATAIGTPFGGGWVTASQQSNITSSGFDLQHRIGPDQFGPGGVAQSNFQFVFRLNEPQTIRLTGFTDYNTAPGELMSEAGAIPLTWAFTSFRTLDFSSVLLPGLYTFTSNEYLRFDYVNTRFSLREEPPRAPAENVPDGGSTALMLGVGAMALVAIRRR